MIKAFDSGIEVLNGRFGPYIKQGKENYKIPKGTDPLTLTEEDCQKLITEAPPKKAFKGKKKAK
jgi:DNA topoisomerase-1